MTAVETTGSAVGRIPDRAPSVPSRLQRTRPGWGAAACPDTTSPTPGRAVTPPLRAIAGALAAATVTVGAMAIWVGTGRVITADATVAGLVALLAALTLIGPHTH